MRRWGIGMVVAATVFLASNAATAQTVAVDGPPICGTETGSAPATGTGVDDGTLRVATFNILHSLDDDADRTLDARVGLLVDALAGARVDAAGLQEVVRSANHGTVAQRVARGMAERTGVDWSWCFFQSNPHLPGEPDSGSGGVGGPVSDQMADLARGGDTPWGEGVAIVSRFPIADERAHRLPARALEVPLCVAESPDDPLAGPTCALDTRQVLWARLDTPCGGLDLFSTHLAHTLSSGSDEIRLAQVVDALQTIDATASRDDALPDLFVGDFNTEEGSPVWQAVVNAGFADTYRSAAPGSAGPTSSQDILAPGPTVSERIDYVFARPGTAPLALADPAVIGGTPGTFEGTPLWPSDHHGVAVSFGSDACASGAASASGGSATPASAEAAAPTGGLPDDVAATGGDAGSAVVLLVLALAAVGLFTLGPRRAT